MGIAGQALKAQVLLLLINHHQAGACTPAWGQHGCSGLARIFTRETHGQGLTGLAWGEGIPAEQQLWVRQLFGQVGEVLDLPESQLDAFLALTSSGPAFVAVVAEALADGAVAAGLPRLLAQRLAHRTLAGSAALMEERDLHPGQLKDMVSSPAGTTIAGLRQLEKAGLRSALIEAVLAAAQRSRELA